MHFHNVRKQTQPEATDARQPSAQQLRLDPIDTKKGSATSRIVRSHISDATRKLRLQRITVATLTHDSKV